LAGDLDKVFTPFIPSSEIFDRLLEYKNNKTPFSLLRFGDGEGLFAFPGWNIPELYNKVCLKHWGEVPDDREKQIIGANIQRAYLNCDLAGLPPKSGPVMDYESNLWIRTYRSFISLYEHPRLFNMGIHIDMLKDKFLEKMISEEKIFYISCRDVDDLLLSKGALEVEHLLISPQYKYEKDKSSEKLYKQIPSIERELRQKDLTGRICLLGAGVAGKHLGIIMKEQGGMVVGIGSVFDYWAGVKSRTWIRKQNLNI